MECENEQQLSDEATGGDIESGTTTSEGIFQFKGKKKPSTTPFKKLRYIRMFLARRFECIFTAFVPALVLRSL